MKNILLKIIEFILNVFTYKDEKEADLEEKTIDDINTPNEEEQPPKVVEIKPGEVIEQPKEEPKEVYVMLTNKEQQTYLKKIGLYTKNIDGIKGVGHKLAIKQFNIIFFNIKNDTYTEDTDKLLRKIYNSFVKSVYMTDDDWQYFKNFKKSEYKCKCKGKYCNGYPHEIAKRLVMADQYLRNYYNAAVTLTSGVRCTTHNANVGGVKKSKHLLGRASDKNVKGKTASEIRKTVKQLPFINYSYDITKKEIHVDVNI